MKNKLYKNRKPRSQFKVVFYATEGGENYKCLVNTGCNVVVNC
jgi:hypothetical protein